VRAILDQFYRWANDDMIHPHVCATFPLDDFKEAMALVTARKSIGRVALVMNEGE
jgi:NADPH:quinone reductase-like Zn-dependent oxidoreductase